MGWFSQLFGPSQPGPDAAVDARQAQAKLQAQAHSKLRPESAPFLLDVRQPEEYEAGHIEGATLIPLGELAGRMGELPRDAEIICVCRSGSRSSHAAQMLAARGYRALNLTGGMIAWSKAGLPIKTGAAR